MCRAWVVWAVAAWVSVTVAWAAPVDDAHELKMEHREAPLDITSNLPSASDDMFIWNGQDGSYRFGMQGQDQWRVESRDASGHVKGRYVYKTPDGQTVDVSYGAGPQGYTARGDAIPGGAAPMIQDAGDEKIGDESVLTLSSPYGALLRKGLETQFPSGNGITTHTDNNAGAIITEIKSQYYSPLAVFPVLNIPGTDDSLVGPPLVDDKPVLPAALAV